MITNRKLCDMEFARTRVGGDPELLRQIVEIVHADLPEVLNRLRTAVTAGDRKERLRAVHSLQGMLVTFDAEAALSALSSLAEMEHSGNRSAREALLEFEEELSRFDVELRIELDRR